MARTRNNDVTNEDLARKALAFVDAHGAEALSFRKLSEATGVPTMTIVNRFGSKNALMKAVLKVMLDESEPKLTPDPDWRASLRHVAAAHRAMALAHPGGFRLFLQVPPFEEPVLHYTSKVFATHGSQGLPPGMPQVFLSIMHAYLPGFMLAEGYSAKADHEGLSEDALLLANLFTEESFNRGLDTIIAGLAANYDLP